MKSEREKEDREVSVFLFSRSRVEMGNFSTQGREKRAMWYFREWSVGVGEVGVWRLWVSGLRALVLRTAYCQMHWFDLNMI